LQFRKFVEEEKGQGGIEYILLVGGILVAAVLAVLIYKRMTTGTYQTVNTSTQNASAKTGDLLIQGVANLSE
jgi:uncharacterized protein (UPF0333 family)